MVGNFSILRVALAAATLAAATACLQVSEHPRGGSDASPGDAPPEVDSLGPAITLVPTVRPALDEFLLQRKYSGFASESRLHQSEGTHFGLVRTFMNPLLYESLAAKNREHPQGAAAVLEMYKADQQLAGWTVLVKVAAQGNAGVGYFWFEAINGSVTTERTAAATCAQCHELGQDLVLTRLPLL